MTTSQKAGMVLGLIVLSLILIGACVLARRNAKMGRATGAAQCDAGVLFLMTVAGWARARITLLAHRRILTSGGRVEHIAHGRGISMVALYRTGAVCAPQMAANHHLLGPRSRGPLARSTGR